MGLSQDICCGEIEKKGTKRLAFDLEQISHIPHCTTDSILSLDE